MNTNIIETPNEIAGKYRYVRLLGEGSNGKTYLAIQINTGINVAIKELKFAQAKDFKSLELFKREAAILSSIKTEGIPRFYESIFPENENTTCYIIQEYVQYPSLQEILNQIGKFNETDTLAILERVSLLLYSLQKVYTPPIIHRDIKPSNILCYKDSDQKLYLYLIDFGAVANPQRRSGGSTVAGTFGYMAPEQLLGDICIQSDYYSLGATALHMLTGVPPYKLESDGFKIDFQSVLSEYAPNTSKAMISLLETLLAPEIDKRPKDANQLHQMIEQVQKGMTVTVKTLENTFPVTLYEYRTTHGRSDKLWTLRFQNRMMSVNTTQNWPKCMGFIRCKNVFIYNGCPFECYEYTFEVNHHTYAGVYSGDLGVTNLAQKLPLRWSVAYNPDNPRMNYLYVDKK